MSNSLPSFEVCLSEATWRRLLAIMTQHHLPCSTKWKKGALVETLTAYLCQPSVLTAVFKTLPQPAYEALNVLLRANGRLPWHLFVGQFGDVRSDRERAEAEAQTVQTIVSPVEHLWLLGLVYRSKKTIPHAVLPMELMTVLVQYQTEAEQIAQPIPSSGKNLLWDMAVFLASIQHGEVRPVRGRWLPPRLLKHLCQRLGLSLNAIPRTERKVAYIAFLHYVARLAGFVSYGETIALTPRAWAWLHMEADGRWQTLWQAWLTTSRDSALPFGWALLNERGKQQVRPHLSQLSEHQFMRLTMWGKPLDWYATWGQEDADFLTAIIDALYWFEVILIGETAEDMWVKLAPRGAWWLTGEVYPFAEMVASSACQLQAPNELHLLHTSAPLHLVQLVSLADWLPTREPTVQILQLTPERVGRAVASGLPLNQIFEQLETALQKPLGRRLKQRLRGWAKEATRVAVRQYTVLEVSEAKLMGKLRRRKRIRQQLGQPLSPVRSVVNPAKLPALLQTLSTMGFQAVAPTPFSGNEEMPSDHLSQLYMTALVYEGLGQHVPLPLMLSSAYLAEIEAQLTVEQVESARQLAEQVLQAVGHSLRGYLQLPFWQEERSNVQTILPRLERAIEAGQDLLLHYWGAAREQALHRRVTPYWLEKRKHTHYLIAYCHLFEAERVFRVDRILACELSD